MFLRPKKWIVAIILLIFVLTGCTSGSNESSASASPEQTPVKKKEPVELYIYSSSGEFNSDTFMDMFGNKIKEKFPHITPKFIAKGPIADLVTTGQTLDILFYSIGATTELLSHQLNYDISDLIKRYNYDLNRLEPATVEAQRKLAKGGIFGLPVYITSLSLFYNKDLFDKFGVKYPKDGMTWDELYDLTKVMSRTDGTTSYHGLTMSMTAAMLLNQASLHYVDPVTNKSNFNTDAFRKQFELITGIAKIPGNTLTPSTAGLQQQIEMFSKEKTAAMHLHFANYGLTQFKDSFNWDVATYPVLKENPQAGPQPWPTYWYVTKNSKYKDDAFEVIAYLTSDEFQQHLSRRGILPVLKNRDIAMKQLGQEIPYLKNKNIAALLPKQFAPSSITTVEQLLGQPPSTAQFQSAYQAVVLNQKDVSKALQDAAEAANKSITEILDGRK